MHQRRRIGAAAGAFLLIATLAIGEEHGMQGATRSEGQATDSGGASGLTPGTRRRVGFTGGPYELMGTVMVVDRASSRVAIECEGKWLQLSVPPAHLARIETGDRVTVWYELRDAGRAARE
jgi:hypothetical protein